MFNFVKKTNIYNDFDESSKIKRFSSVTNTYKINRNNIITEFYGFCDNSIKYDGVYFLNQIKLIVKNKLF